MEGDDDATSGDRAARQTKIGQSVHSLGSCLDRIDDCSSPETGSLIRNLHLQRWRSRDPKGEQFDEANNERQSTSAGAGSKDHLDDRPDRI